MNLVEGCIAREFNRRKKRSGAFWEDNYHATAVQTGKHLIQCMLYIDLNMVRAGVVKSPDDWSYSGYNEIFYNRQRYRLIDTNELVAQLGFPSLTAYKHIYKSWITEAIQNSNLQREKKWTEYIAIGSKEYVANMRSKLDSRARNREIIGNIDTYMLK
jgi:putative transposase